MTRLNKKPQMMKNLVVLIVFMFISVSAVAQVTTKEPVKKTVDSTTITAKITKDSTLIASIAKNKRALIEADFDQAKFLFRTKKSKHTQIC